MTKVKKDTLLAIRVNEDISMHQGFEDMPMIDSSHSKFMIDWNLYGKATTILDEEELEIISIPPPDFNDAEYYHPSINIAAINAWQYFLRALNIYTPKIVRDWVEISLYMKNYSKGQDKNVYLHNQAKGWMKRNNLESSMMHMCLVRTVLKWQELVKMGYYNSPGELLLQPKFVDYVVFEHFKEKIEKVEERLFGGNQPYSFETWNPQRMQSTNYVKTEIKKFEAHLKELVEKKANFLADKGFEKAPKHYKLYAFGWLALFQVEQLSPEVIAKKHSEVVGKSVEDSAVNKAIAKKAKLLKLNLRPKKNVGRYRPIY